MFNVGDSVIILADTPIYNNEGLPVRHPYTTIYKATNAVVIARRSDGWARVQYMARTTPFQREAWVDCRHLSYEEPPPVAGTVVSLKGGDIAVYLPEFYDTLQWATFDPCDVEWVSNEWVRANRS